MSRFVPLLSRAQSFFCTGHFWSGTKTVIIKSVIIYARHNSGHHKLRAKVEKTFFNSKGILTSIV